MPPRRRRLAATKRNSRKKKAQKRYEKEVNSQKVVIRRLQQNVTQLRKQSRMRQVSTIKFLPNFEIDGVKELPEGSVRPLPSSSVRG